MRWLVLLVLFVDVSGIHAQMRISVAQLEDFLLSHRAAKESDQETAQKLSAVQLAEQLSESRLARLLSKLRLGPKAEEQVRLLAITSIFEAPPRADLPSSPSPDQPTQERILASARDYVAASARRLPDFMAIRKTDAFATLPPWGDQTPVKPETELHFTGERRFEVTYRLGHEVSSLTNNAAPVSETFTTWGEFGPILATILGDSSLGTIVWSRWEVDAEDKRRAVFHYAVPKSASHDQIDLCCYLRFHDTPAYHGDLSIDPGSGTIFQLTLEAEFSDDAVLRESKMAVRYGPVDIGSQTYICPLRGVAVGVIHDAQLEKIDGLGLQRFVNVVHFTDYHKFGSTTRILTSQ
jgi:hypothetical protein